MNAPYHTCMCAHAKDPATYNCICGAYDPPTPEVFKCCSPHCPGYPYAASQFAHPIETCYSGPKRAAPDPLEQLREISGCPAGDDLAEHIAHMRNCLEAIARREWFGGALYTDGMVHVALVGLKRLQP